jgi:hypothetical protein
MRFDERGLIQPAKGIQMTQDQFRQAFVDDLPSEIRSQIYAQYERYTINFTRLVSGSFAQWIGGSFTTAKANPRDLDLLTILKKSEYDRHQELIEQEFRRRSITYPLVDAYFLPYPATDEEKKSFFKVICSTGSTSLEAHVGTGGANETCEATSR